MVHEDEAVGDWLCVGVWVYGVLWFLRLELQVSR